MKKSKLILCIIILIVGTIIYPPGILLFILGFLITFIMRLRKIEKQTYEENRQKAKTKEKVKYW